MIECVKLESQISELKETNKIKQYATLTEDAVGKGLVVYAKKGDKVEIISIFDKVAIVEFKGNRFPIKIDKVNYPPTA